jgi:hypothetical protein
VVFKTTAIDHSAIPPRGHFIRKSASLCFHHGVFFGFDETRAAEDWAPAFLLTFRSKFHGLFFLRRAASIDPMNTVRHEQPGRHRPIGRAP